MPRCGPCDFGLVRATYLSRKWGGEGQAVGSAGAIENDVEGGMPIFSDVWDGPLSRRVWRCLAFKLSSSDIEADENFRRAYASSRSCEKLFHMNLGVPVSHS